MNGPYATTVRRAALPEVMFTPDVALALHSSPETARRYIREGHCGPHFRVGRRLGVLRETFLGSLLGQSIERAAPAGAEVRS